MLASYRTDYLTSLKASILLRYKCDAHHRETVWVQQSVAGNELLWEGYIEVFDLIAHPAAAVCYAWSNFEPGEVKIITVLGNRVVDSPQNAVRSVIFREIAAPNPSALSFSKRDNAATFPARIADRGRGSASIG